MKTTKKIKVAIVEDYKLISQAIAGIVNSFDNFEVVHLNENGVELKKNLTQNTQLPDIVLMDVNMPILNGIETTKWLKENHPEILVLALSVDDEEQTILKMIKAGAKGYLLKDADQKTLENALLQLIKEGVYHSDLVNDALTHSLETPKLEIPLKDTEITFLKLICTELTYKEVADKMCLSPKTIDGYRDQLFVKLNVKNRIGLVLFAIKNKLVAM